MDLEVVEDETRPQRNGVLREASALWRRDIVAATTYLEQHGDLSDPEIAFIYMRWVVLSRIPDKYQQTMREAIRQLPRMQSEPSARYIDQLLHYSERACLELPLLENLLEQTSAARLQDGGVQRTWDAVAYRQAYRRRLATSLQGITLISLGLHCSAWSLPNRWGFRRPDDFEQCATPFSLAVHKASGVIEALEQDFHDYAAPEQIMATVTKNRLPVAARKDRGAVWNHHTGEYWIKNDYSHLQEDLARLTQNFRAVCERKGVVFLMCDCPAPSSEGAPEFLPQLQDALRQHTRRRDNFLILTTQRTSASDSVRKLDATTFFVTCPYPSKDYVWFDDNAADVGDGLAYEQRYVTSLLKCLAGWGLIEDSELPPSQHVSVDTDRSDAPT